MPAQQQLLPEAEHPHAQREAMLAPVWLQRMSLVIFVLFCFYIGVVLTMIPWSQRFWEQNGWMQGHPALNNVLQRGWFRGIVSGIGLMDLWIGVSELLHYRDFRPVPETRAMRGVPEARS